MRQDLSGLTHSAARAYREGRLAEAFTTARDILRAHPGHLEAMLIMGVVAARQQHPEVAIPLLTHVFEQDPAAPQARHWLTYALRRTPTLDPEQILLLHRLGDLLAQDLDFQGAAECAEKMLAVDAHSVAGHSLLATACVGLNKPAEAAEHLAMAEEFGPDRPDVLTHSGTLLQAIGKMEEAAQKLRRSIEIEPAQGYAYFALVRTRKVLTEDLPLVRQMETVCKEPGLAPRHIGYIEFALGKAYADFADPEQAMCHYDAANLAAKEWKFGSTPFDRDGYRAGIDFAIKNLNRQFVARHQGIGIDDSLPIFVVGMIRAGTTLAEQILSSHPEIGAAGEQRFWSEHRGDAFQAPGNVLDRNRLHRLTDEYLAALHKIAPGKARVVDKMPDNYAHLGVIHAALPNARIIHIRRDPIDTCLSIWMTPNGSRTPWLHDKGHIVYAYRQYLRIMEHWRTVLGPDRLLEVDYEELVADPESISRRMIDFSGMDWDENCLFPEKNTRAVATPSDWQVRQPIYRNAVGRGRMFEPWLGEFRELVEG